jgi:hypothetical protein
MTVPEQARFLGKIQPGAKRRRGDFSQNPKGLTLPDKRTRNYLCQSINHVCEGGTATLNSFFTRKKEMCMSNRAFNVNGTKQKSRRFVLRDFCKFGVSTG